MVGVLTFVLKGLHFVQLNCFVFQSPRKHIRGDKKKTQLETISLQRVNNDHKNKSYS